MTNLLTNQEKAQIITSHIRNLAFSKYNLEIDLITENAKSSPNAVAVSSINASMSDVSGQISILETELAKYPVESE
jgi:hypothetical protein